MTHMTPLVALAEQAYRQQRIREQFERAGGERRQYRLARLRRTRRV